MIAWLGTGVALLALSLVYPVIGTMARTGGFAGEPTLDGLSGLRRFQPDEHAASVWLRDTLDGLPVVLEAAGPDYSEGGRVAARTGLPTVVGWTNHEWQERGALAPVEARVRDVETLYTTDDAALARRLLDRYDVRYVYLGSYERERYGPAAGTTLARIGRPVFEAGQVTVYAVEPDGNGAPSRAGEP